MALFGSAIPAEQNNGRRDSYKQKISFVWDIKNMGDYSFEPGEYITSPRFFTDDSVLQSNWKLRMFPAGYDGNSKNKLQIAVFPLKSCEKTNLVKCDISIVDFEREKMNLFSVRSDQRIFIKEAETDVIQPVSLIEIFTCVITDDQLTRLYKTNILSIMCEVYLAVNISFLIPPLPEVRMWSSTQIKISNTSTTVKASRDPQTTILACGHSNVQIQYYLRDKDHVAIKLLSHPEVDKLFCRIVVKSKHINNREEDVLECDAIVDEDYIIKLKAPAIVQKAVSVFGTPITQTPQQQIQILPQQLEQQAIPQSSTFGFNAVGTNGSSTANLLNIGPFPSVTIKISIKFLPIATKDSFAYDFTSAGKQLQNDIKKLFTKPDFGDVSINVGGKSLRAHKDILSARSTVFATMFGIDMLESSSNLVTITEFSFGTMHALLKYIYYGKTEQDEDINHVELFKAAALYDLKILQRDCETILCDNVDMDNVTSLLSLSELYYAPMLKISVLTYLRGAAVHRYD